VVTIAGIVATYWHVQHVQYVTKYSRAASFVNIMRIDVSVTDVNGNTAVRLCRPVHIQRDGTYIRHAR
jgi:hypothetical protein